MGVTGGALDPERPGTDASSIPIANAALHELREAGLLPAGTILGHERYSVFLTTEGAGVSAYVEWILTGWTGDSLQDPGGFYVYLRDRGSGQAWPATLRPAGGDPRSCTARSFEDGLRFQRSAEGIESALEVRVPVGETVELRRLTLRNETAHPRDIDLTSYAEVVLHSASAHAGHPAFTRLFVHARFVPDARALLFRRRPRGEGEHFPFLAHALLDGEVAEFEADRARFLGRGRTARAPRAMLPGVRLSGTTGDVLDPVCALRTKVPLAPGAVAIRTFLLGAAPTFDETLALVRAWSEPGKVERLFGEAMGGLPA